MIIIKEYSIKSVDTYIRPNNNNPLNVCHNIDGLNDILSLFTCAASIFEYLNVLRMRWYMVCATKSHKRHTDYIQSIKEIKNAQLHIGYWAADASFINYDVYGKKKKEEKICVCD